MVKPEKTGERDLTYSRWHRTLPNYCYMIDLDSIEWRPDRGIVALIETCRGESTVFRKKFQLKVIREIANKLKVPCYLVIYHARNANLNFFEVYDLTKNNFPNCPKKYMDEKQYRLFISSL